VVKALLRAGCKTDIQDKDGRTALHEAAFKGRGGVVKALLKAGCDPDIQDTDGRDGETALLLAVKNQHEDVVEMLLKAGCKTDIQAAVLGYKSTYGEGFTALHWAVYNNENGLLASAGITRLLLEAGCNPDIRNQRGYTAMILARNEAYEQYHPEIIRLIQRSKKRRNETPEGCGWQLRESCKNINGCGSFRRKEIGMTDAAMISRLLSRPDVKSFINLTDSGDGYTMQFVGEDFDHDDEDDDAWGRLCTGWTALHYAAYKGLGAVVDKLLKAGCNPDIQDTDGRTALHVAALKGHGGVVEVLLKAGCDPDIQTKDGYTAMNSAVLKGHEGVVNKLNKRLKLERKEEEEVGVGEKEEEEEDIDMRGRRWWWGGRRRRI